MVAKRENSFQANLIKKIKKLFPGCIVLKNDADYIQGMVDLLVLFGEKWFSLECKRDKNAPHRPNQDYYVSKMNDMSFSRFIYPENEQEVLDELQQTFKS